MTTTAHEDQFTIGTQAIEPVRQPYNTVSILRRNIAALEVALRQQTERAEAAEAELARLAQQKPVAWRHENGNIFLPWQKDMIVTGAVFSPLFAAPVPASHKGATHCDDCGLTWLDDGLNPLGCPYCKDTVPAPDVPATCNDGLQVELAEMLKWMIGQRGKHGHSHKKPGIWDDGNKPLPAGKVCETCAMYDKARALLQSADEVRHD